MNGSGTDQAGRFWEVPRTWVVGLLAAIWIGVGSLSALAEPGQGMYFAKKQYVGQALPKFAETKDKLPVPIYDEQPLHVQM